MAVAPLFSIASMFVLGVMVVLYVRLQLRYKRMAEEWARAIGSSSSDRAALERVERLVEREDEFVSTVSHEIRIPLTSIRAALGLLSSGVLGQFEPRALRLLNVASSNTERLLRLTNDILDLSRADAGINPLRIQQCRISDLIEQAVDTLGPMADSVGVFIVVDHDTSRLDGEVAGDPDRILQVFCNLLSNAIKFSDHGSSVVLQSYTEDEFVTVRVRDAGRGIPAEKLESIFERFIQVNPADARQRGGSGLGLAICRSIIHQHQGTIYAMRNDSELLGEPGTTLVVKLPALGENRLCGVAGAA